MAVSEKDSNEGNLNQPLRSIGQGRGSRNLTQTSLPEQYLLPLFIRECLIDVKITGRVLVRIITVIHRIIR